MQFQLNDLPYKYDALEPFLDEETVKIHHGKHHKTYTDNLNKALEEHNIIEDNLEGVIFPNISLYPVAIKNNGGGYWNHDFFWHSLAPSKKESLPENLLKEIQKSFGSLEKFHEEFSQKALAVFGSGWCWLVFTSEQKLKIIQTQNQENPLMDIVSKKEGLATPMLVVDVWEHAYYLKYQNKRADFIENFWKIVAWDKVGDRLEKALAK